MKTATLALVLTAAFASTTIACSSEEDAKEVSTAKAVSELRSPTGSFSKASAGKAFGGFRTQRAEGNVLSSKTNGGGGNVKPGSLRIRDASAAGASGTQGCPGGGSMSFAAEQAPEGQTLKIGFSACRFEDGEGFDGNALLLVSQKSLVDLGQSSAPAKSGGSKTPTNGDEAGDDENSSGLKEAEGRGALDAEAGSVLLAFEGNALSGTKQSPLSLALYVESSYTFVSVTVPDGKLVVGMTDDNHAIVKSKDGTWYCSQSSSRWACSSDKGEELEATEEIASAGDDSKNSGSSDGTSSSTGSSDDDGASDDGFGEQG